MKSMDAEVLEVNRLVFAIDTNVLLDFYAGGRTNTPESKRLVDRCISNDVHMIVACHQLKDLFYGMQVSLKRELREVGGEVSEAGAVAIREAAWACVVNAATLYEMVGADLSDVWMAIRYKTIHPDFEDDLVIAAAVRGNATHLVTNDQQLLRNTAKATSLVHAITSAEALALLAA